jgi:CheY-like chemotaxis protein
MPDGGKLTISGVAEAIAEGHRAALTPGYYVRLSVSDTGIGMDEATLAKAVEPFFSTKGVGKGTGLGLSMVHGLASQLGGAMTISSRPGLGTTVDLFLPAAAAEESRRTSSQPVLHSGAAGAGKVLLVDDEELVRASTAEMLTDLGFAVVEAASAKEALACLAAERFDNVVTDHLMPGMTGTELARSIAEDYPQTPVLVISGYAEIEGVAVNIPRLTKPFRQDELARSLAGLRKPAA